MVQRFLLEQIEEFKKAWPLIKICTGESFEKEHWRKLTSLLKMPKEVTYDNMIFGNLVDSVPVMIAKQKELKELIDRALGEVTIREAINELRIWCDSTEFELTEYNQNNRITPLVKEWKEIIT